MIILNDEIKIINRFQINTSNGTNFLQKMIEYNIYITVFTLFEFVDIKNSISYFIRKFQRRRLWPSIYFII